MKEFTKYICVQYTHELYRFTGVFDVCVYKSNIKCNACNILGSYILVDNPDEGGLCSKCQITYKNIYSINNLPNY